MKQNMKILLVTISVSDSLTRENNCRLAFFVSRFGGSHYECVYLQPYSVYCIHYSVYGAHLIIGRKSCALKCQLRRAELCKVQAANLVFNYSFMQTYMKACVCNTLTELIFLQAS